ncbi:ATP-grasp domain-containing protein [Algoriphagus sp.]|uniref:ATP-grasp domain-containing protein n=1 Tax=Algoriphagus sp. TaxID=1872435 RepID=UPI003F729DB8
MEGKQTAIVLGGTAPHIALIEKLKMRGYYTVLVDYLDEPPAKTVADCHIKESTLDKEAVLRIARDLNAQLVISACVDQANLTACYVAEKLALPHPYSYQIAKNVTNKGLMKKIMLENGIPTSRFVYVSSIEEIKESSLEFPVMIKPADSCGSAGVKRANNLDDLEEYLAFAIQISRANKVIVEEFKDGMEVSIYGFVLDKKVHFLMVSERLSVSDGVEQVIKCYSTIAPANISKDQMNKLNQIADKIAVCFDLDNTPIHIQAILNDKEVSIIEFAPRVGGGVSYKTIQLNTGFDILESTINSYLNVRNDMNFHFPKHYYSVNIMYANPGVFDHVTGIQKLIDDQIIEEFFSYKSKGVEIFQDKASSSRIGVFIVKAKDRVELFDKIKNAIEEVDVYDKTGKSIFRKDLFAGSEYLLSQ